MLTKDIRHCFLNFFQKHHHLVARSSSLIPSNDPTLLFTAAGMVPFKDFFTAHATPPHPRMTTVQKCLRAGGKHNDLDNVGYTARHHTFFEMLGNFSFGDYFKEEAIFYAWKLLTQEFNLSKDRLWITVYAEDEEAAILWKKISGFPEHKIIRITTEDNFWSAGDVGPCGPCSEIFYDHGEGIPGDKPGTINADGDRFVEIWNLVFMQYEQHKNHHRTPLPHPSIDTGMGIERIASVLQGKINNFDTDIFTRLIQTLHREIGTSSTNHSHRVIADHVRACSFLIADGLLPSNEGRGYVLRRILRRAIRHVHALGRKTPILSYLVPTLIDLMANDYPELLQSQALIESTLEDEENKFTHILDQGMNILYQALKNLSSGDPLSGDMAFKLYDTYGFPLDLTQDILRSHGHPVDIEGFEACMGIQKEKARKAWSGEHLITDINPTSSLQHIGTTTFVGYETLEAQGEIIGLLSKGELVQTIHAGEEALVVTDITPFYAESGGQIGDTGNLLSETIHAKITDTQKGKNGNIYHVTQVLSGFLSIGDKVNLSVDILRRNKIMSHHSATHLLQASLRKIIGPHVTQRGSLVTDEKLRFDFTHTHALTLKQLQQIEEQVNTWILDTIPTYIANLDYQDALKQGALALFSEKYTDSVRVVTLGDGVSVELCGGTHVKTVRDIGPFKIVKEHGISSGIRRIEAIAGYALLTYISELEGKIEVERSAHQLALQHQRQKTSSHKDISVPLEILQVGNILLLYQHFHEENVKILKTAWDSIRQKHPACIGLFTTYHENRISFVVGVKHYPAISAVDCVLKIGQAFGHEKCGGGRSDLAQGGGENIPSGSKIVKALQDILNASY